MMDAYFRNNLKKKTVLILCLKYKLIYQLENINIYHLVNNKNII